MVCIVGEIIYAGSVTALVTALAPVRVLGRALARFQISTGFGLAVSPAVISALASRGSAALWGSRTAATLLSASAVATERTEERRSMVAAAGREQARELGERLRDVHRRRPWPDERADRAVCSGDDEFGRHYSAGRIATFARSEERDQTSLRAVVDYWWAPFHDAKRNKAGAALTEAPWVRLHLSYHCPESERPGELC